MNPTPVSATRQHAIAQAHHSFDSGDFRETLARRVAIPTESQNPARAEALAAYLQNEMQPAFEAMGFSCQTLTHPLAKAPFLFAQRIEDARLPTVFGYGQGDVIRGVEKEWKKGTLPGLRELRAQHKVMFSVASGEIGRAHV